MRAFLLTISLLICTTNSYAVSTLTTQQDKMKSCNAEAGTKLLKGDERQAFMSKCLKADNAVNTQQNKMKTCNADAATKNLKGDERQAFMSKCLKADNAVN